MFDFVPAPDGILDQKHTFIDGVSDRKLILFVTGTEGTTRMWCNTFACVSAGICERLGFKGLLISAEAPSVPAGATLLERCGPVTLQSILPVTSVIVHHGGIGTSAAAMRYGVPQLIVPRVFAQPINAEWLRRLGVCAVLEPRAYNVENGSRVIRMLQADASYRLRNQTFSSRIYSTEEMAKLCDFLERSSRELHSQWIARRRQARAADQAGAIAPNRCSHNLKSGGFG
jgi:UDP:flavonoid glycosyltransferase YjiC (YdhE family)